MATALTTPTLDRLVEAGELPGYSLAVRDGGGSTLVATRGTTGPVDPETAV